MAIPMTDMPRLTPPRRTGCMTWPATSGSGQVTYTRACTTASCAAVRRIPTRWTCGCGCATMRRRHTTARGRDSGARDDARSDDACRPAPHDAGPAPALPVEDVLAAAEKPADKPVARD